MGKGNQRSRGALRFALAVVAMLSGACGSASVSEVFSLKELGIDDGASQGQATSALVTEKGAVMTLKTGAHVQVPDGAVKGQVTLGIERPDDKRALALVKSLPAGEKVASAPYIVTPHGTQFEKDVEVILPVAAGRDAQKIKVMWLSDEKDTVWKEHERPIVVSDKATFSVKHFSVLLLVEGALPISGGANDVDGGPPSEDMGGELDGGLGAFDGGDEGGFLDGGDEGGAPVDVSPARAITAGGFHACTLHENGTVACWGSNEEGQLGGETSNSTSATPIAVSGLVDAVAVAAGDRHTCALREGGHVVCWGERAYGQFGGAVDGEPSPVPIEVSGLSDAQAIVAGGSHTCALREGGTVVCWGNGELGQLGSEVEDYMSVVPLEVGGLSGVTSLAAGDSHTCALLEGGAAACWGNNQFSQLGAETTNLTSFTPVTVADLSGALALAAGHGHTCALRADRTVGCWGQNERGQLGGAALGDPSLEPVVVGGISTATALSSRFWSTCALLEDGSVRCWGNNDNGQLGAMTPEVAPLMVITVGGLSDATALAVGENFVCALRAGGDVACWGSNNRDRLGIYGSW